MGSAFCELFGSARDDGDEDFAGVDEDEDEYFSPLLTS